MQDKIIGPLIVMTEFSLMLQALMKPNTSAAGFAFGCGMCLCFLS